MITAMTSKKNVFTLITLSILAFASIFAYSFTERVYADDIKKNLCGGAALSLSSDSDECKPDTECIEWNDSSDKSKGCKVYKDEGSLNSIIATVVNLLTVIVGIVAVIMIIFGGFKYITSSGDSGNISSAKNTIVYAIVGLIIVALAQVIVRFVLNKTT